MNGRFIAFLLGPPCSCTEGGVRGWEPLGRRQETRLKGAGRAHERGEGWPLGGRVLVTTGTGPRSLEDPMGEPPS